MLIKIAIVVGVLFVIQTSVGLFNAFIINKEIKRINKLIGAP